MILWQNKICVRWCCLCLCLTKAIRFGSYSRFDVNWLKVGTPGKKEEPRLAVANYRRTCGVSATGLSPFLRKLYDIIRTTNTFFYFIPTRRVISTTIYGFLFTRQFRQDAILSVKPSAYGIPFFRTSSWWLCCGPSCGLWLYVGALNRGCAKNIKKTTSM